MSSDQTLLKAPGRVLSTMEADGSRRWLYPKLAKGRFLTRRRAVAYGLMAVFMLLPYLSIGGHPAMFLDIVHRRFYLFGLTFLPTDTFLLALFGVSVLLTIFFLTALLGRVWCGWACPQTVYMEFLFRPIERLFTGRAGTGGKPRDEVPGWRVAAMYATYLLASLYLAHTFLSYFVGVEQLRHWVTQSPARHPAAFMVILVTTGLMLFNFTIFREQTCIIACPYGRFQSVLMDKSSLVVSYDRNRGEPRGAVRKTALPVVKETGDCVDCAMCVSVCPTGIDIRDGLQAECVGCAQCIDACDAVMSKIGRSIGLIRYGSQSEMAGEPTRLVRARVIIYPAILALLVGLLAFLLVTKSPTDVTILRGLGRPFIVTEGGEVENLLRIKLTNRTDAPQRLKITALSPAGARVLGEDETVELPAQESAVEPVRVIVPPSAFKFGGGAELTLRLSGDGVQVDRSCQLVGPIGLVHEGESHKESRHEEH